MEGQVTQKTEGRSYISSPALLHAFVELLELHNHKDGWSYFHALQP